MLQDLLHYLFVIGLSMFKFILGPVTARLYEMSFLESTIFTVLGMMISVYLFTTVLGAKIHSWIMDTFYKNKKLFTKKNRRMVKIWRKYGLKGVAFLTPIIFTPIGGTIVAVSFGEHKKQIYKYMFISAVFWSSVFSYVMITLKVENIFLIFK